MQFEGAFHPNKSYLLSKMEAISRNKRKNIASNLVEDFGKAKTLPLEKGESARTRPTPKGRSNFETDTADSLLHVSSPILL